jgi:hypothetical protein
MMAALGNAGLVPSEAVKEDNARLEAEHAEALEEHLAQAEKEKATEIAARLETLRTTNSVDMFRGVARKLLVLDHNLLDDVIALASDTRLDEREGISLLRSHLGELKQNLAAEPGANLERLVRHHLSK